MFATSVSLVVMHHARKTLAKTAFDLQMMTRHTEVDYQPTQITPVAFRGGSRYKASSQGFSRSSIQMTVLVLLSFSSPNFVLERRKAFLGIVQRLHGRPLGFVSSPGLSFSVKSRYTPTAPAGNIHLTVR